MLYEQEKENGAGIIFADLIKDIDEMSTIGLVLGKVSEEKNIKDHIILSYDIYQKP